MAMVRPTRGAAPSEPETPQPEGLERPAAQGPHEVRVRGPFDEAAYEGVAAGPRLVDAARARLELLAAPHRLVRPFVAYTLRDLSSLPALAGGPDPLTASRLGVADAQAWVAATPGYAELSSADRQRFLAVMGGEANPRSLRARAALSAVPFVASAADLRLALSDKKSMPSVISVDESLPEQHALVKLTGPTYVERHAFYGATLPADVYTLEVDGRSVPVFAPHPDAQGGWMGKDPARSNLSPAQVADLVGRLPAANRALLQSVTINPVRNPDDVYWGETYGMPNFESDMACGSDGKVLLFALSVVRDPGEAADSLAHETGHVWSGRLWIDPQRKAEWEAAVASDGLVVSAYAKSSLGEDAAETVALYSMVRGTLREAEYRAMFPARFGILDQAFAAP